MSSFHDSPRIDWAETGRQLIRERIAAINEAARTGQPISLSFESLISDLYEHIVRRP